MRIALTTERSLRRKLLLAAGIVGLLAVSGSLYAISRAPKNKSDPPIVYELASSDVFTARPQPLLRTLRFTGTLSPVRHAHVKSHTTGTILELRVREGDAVHRGQLLVRVDPRNAQAELDSRAAALRKAQADLVLDTKNRDNSVTLLKQKLISQNSFDQTVANYDISIANEQAAAAQWQLGKNALDDTEIRADFDGIVADRAVQVGERVTPDTTLLSIVALSQMQLEALIPVTDVPEVAVGQEANFKVAGFDERKFHGNVSRISPQTETGSRSLTVYLNVNNADGALKGGMFADGELILQRSADALAVPQEAIRSENGAHYLLVLNNGVVSKRNVTLGDNYPSAGLTAITTGLDLDAQVIVPPIAALQPGVRTTFASRK